MWNAADNIEGCGAGNIGFTSERALDQVNDMRGKVGDIAQGLVPHLAPFPVSAAQQMALVDLAATGTINSGYMNWTISLSHTLIIHQIRGNVKGIRLLLLATFCIRIRYDLATKRWGNFGLV
jgi:hypothetical protein